MKETIIFIHGLTGTKRAFKKQMEYFHSTFHTYSYDLIGHGEHKGKNHEFTLENLVMQLEDFYEQNGIQEAHLCSLSYGCYPSAIFANKWGKKVKSLCFIGGHYNAQSQLFNVFQHYWKTRDEEYSTWLQNYANDIYPKVNRMDPYSAISKKIYYKYALELDQHIIKTALHHRLQFDLRTVLTHLSVPVLWVMGEHDTLYKSALVELNQVIPHVIYKEIKYAGHAANLFRPTCFQKIYENFLESHQNENNDFRILDHQTI